MLFAFVVFWTYIAFSQYMLYWYANMPEETYWYLRRGGAWLDTSVFLALGHFAVPFFFLMSRHIKRRPRLLLTGAIWMLLMHLLDMYWLIMPTHYPEGPHIGLVDLFALLGVGGLWLGFFAWRLGQGSLVPEKDPRLSESLAFENF
jgi:hypothetical protein